MASLDTLGTDYRAITEACGLLDRSERGKLALTGADAGGFLQGQVSNDVESLAAGTGCYAAFLTPKGKMLGDVRILNADDELLLDTERSTLQALFNMIRRFSIGYQVELHKRTLECGLLSLIGPDADRLAGADWLPSEEHAHIPLSIGGIQARAIRTDVGLDLLCDAADTDALRAVLEESGAVVIGEAAAECLRVERGRPRYGIDLDDTVIPQEAGLNERAVSFTKGCYVGQETVARLFYRGKPNRQLRGLRLTGPAEPGEELLFEGRPVGRLDERRAVAALRRDRPRPGPPRGAARIDRHLASEGFTAQVTELPFR